MKTVIEMAKESGFTADEFAWHDHMFERLAELVRADERLEFLKALRQLHDSYSLASDSKAIRARSNT